MHRTMPVSVLPIVFRDTNLLRRHGRSVLVQDSRLETVVLELLAGILPFLVYVIVLDVRSTGSYDRLVEKLEGGDCVVLVLGKVDFLPPDHCPRKLARAAIAFQCLGGNGPHEITQNELEGSADVLRGLIRMSLLSTLPDGPRHRPSRLHRSSSRCRPPCSKSPDSSN